MTILNLTYHPISNTGQCTSEGDHQKPDLKFPDNGVPIRSLTVSSSGPVLLAVL
jgi:hypothetical protein